MKKIVNQKFLNSFTTVHTFNETDQVLQTISYWPETSSVEYFRNKLKFQIQHSLFRYLDIVRYFVHFCKLLGLKFKRVVKTLRRC